ncbi:MAG: DUF2254 domain-containing protein [Deltaproteobacteria bacterium]|nr:DUF2254 domain-containing protein [Deltaproteobacteria bacterium]MCW5805773.1 DUF2254 domain-containing protein [Deltaproteobacteria bacterium]
MSSRRRRRRRGATPSSLRLWLVPMAILGGIALLGFAAFYLFDDAFTGGPGAAPESDGVGRYVRFDPGGIGDALSGLAGMTAAVLGIVITVVSLLVQLTSERYTGVAAMFLRDRTNIMVMAYYVVVCVVGVATSLTLHDHWVPRATVLAMTGATAFGLIMMLPYFAYVFRFLAPTNLVSRIEQQAITDVVASATEEDEAAMIAGQAPAITALEELTDITSNSISGKDKIIASRCVDAIKDFVVSYLAVKAQARSRWFEIGDGIRDNPDFVAMDPESLRELEADRTWLEWKALRQYLGIYAEAQAEMPDINYLIAIDTRYVGEAALERNDRPVVELAFRFMNSYLRAALNARAVRTAYNVMNQYRLLVESMIRGKADDAALEGVRHMIYYGRTSYDMQLGFVTETVAYDVSALCEFAHAQNRAGDLDDKMLAMFLELDQPLRLRRQEAGLQGIRKAQLKLACYYLANGAEDRANKIALDMAGEDRDRLAAIREQLGRVESKEFWEIIDRGRNFEYMPPHQKKQMDRFFEMLPPSPAS